MSPPIVLIGGCLFSENDHYILGIRFYFTVFVANAKKIVQDFIYGGSMVDHNKNRQKLIDGAIKAVAECGLEGLTTRSIEQYSGLKDSYIYRYFEDKEDLLKKAFLREDETFVRVIEHYFPIMYEEKYEFRERCYLLWQNCWKYLISNPDTCKFYVRYYYSTYFKQKASESHIIICSSLMDKVKNAFPKDVNTTLLLHHLLETMLNFGMKVAMGEAEDSDEYLRTTFNFCYNIINSCMASGEKVPRNTNENDKMSYLEFYSIVNNWK